MADTIWYTFAKLDRACFHFQIVDVRRILGITTKHAQEDSPDKSSEDQSAQPKPATKSVAFVTPIVKDEAERRSSESSSSSSDSDSDDEEKAKKKADKNPENESNDKSAHDSSPKVARNHSKRSAMCFLI